MKETETAIKMYLEIESALVPLDEVKTLLNHVHDSFSLGNTDLDEIERMNLLMNYNVIGQMLMLAARTIDNVQRDYRELRPCPAREPATDDGTQPQPKLVKLR